MNLPEGVAGAISDRLSRLRLYEDPESLDASHVVDTDLSRTSGTAVVARAHRFAPDGDTRIPMGWVRVAVTYEPDEESS